MQDIVLDHNLLRESSTNYEGNQKISVVLTDEKLNPVEKEEDKETDINPVFNNLKEWIYEISKKYGVPYEIMTTIGHQESHGDWETNGIISSTGDYGQFQINLRWNFEDINRDLGFSVDELLHDPYKNIEASAYLLQRIMRLYGYTIQNFDYENIFGTYNAWTNWQNSSMARNYVYSCMRILAQNLYPYS